MGLHGVACGLQPTVQPGEQGVARRWGLLSASIGHHGADLLIAATALDRGLTVVTRNLRHFAHRG